MKIERTPRGKYVVTKNGRQIVSERYESYGKARTGACAEMAKAPKPKLVALPGIVALPAV